MTSERMRAGLHGIAERERPGGLERRAGVAGVLARLGLSAERARCDRFEIGDKLGEGAMGVVYRGWDPKLRRHVALKVLRGDADLDLADRLQREARALARQQHPNIVSVLGFGRDHGRTFIAMELVEGVTLAQWSAAHPPGDAQRFAIAAARLRVVGEALAAAHGVGLVHRDVKPANILVRNDGVVKLADFGLARVQLSIPTLDGTGIVDTNALLGEDSDGLSRTGVAVGTPRYMAPQQHMGEPADAKSDQFAFAVTAWEVLGGAPPFSGRTQVELVDAMEAGRFDRSGEGPIPSPLRAVLRRAMAARAEDRFATMHDLLAAWSRALRARRRRRRIAGLGLVAASLVAILLLPRGPAPCDGRDAAAAWSRVWNPQRQRVIADALTSRRVAWAADTRDGLDRALEDHGRRFIEADIAACEASRSGEPTAMLAFDHVASCRKDAFATADALLARVEAGTDDLAERLLDAVADLPGPTACGAEDREEHMPAAAPLRDALARARADLLAGRYGDAAVQARRIAELAGAANLARLQSEAWTVGAAALAELGEPHALTLSEQAYALAMAEDAPALAFDPAIAAAIVLVGRDDPDGARRWLRHADSAAARDAPRATREIERARVECRILQAEGHLVEALDCCEGALALLADASEPAPRLRAKIRRHIEKLYQALGRHGEALALAVELRDEAEADLGAWHPTTGGLTMNVGTAAMQTKDFVLAEQSLLRAAEIFDAAYGPTNKWVVSARMNLGALHHARHDDARAEAALVSALAATGGRQDAATARVLHNLAEARRRLGRPQDTLALLERVRVIEDDVLGPESLQTATTHHTRGNAYLDLGRLDDAERELTIARDRWRAAGRVEHRELEQSAARLQRLRQQGDTADASRP